MASYLIDSTIKELQEIKQKLENFQSQPNNLGYYYLVIENIDMTLNELEAIRVQEDEDSEGIG